MTGSCQIPAFLELLFDEVQTVMDKTAVNYRQSEGHASQALPLRGDTAQNPMFHVQLKWGQSALLDKVHEGD